MSADSRYVLWVNVAEVGRGPIRSQPRRWRYNEYDIAPYLRSGRNAVAVLVTYYGHANSFWQPAASSGVMGRDAQLVVEARVGDEWLLTDERWRVLRSRARRALGPSQSLDAVPVELLDARELDPSWVEPEFDDSSWVDATMLKATHDGALGSPALRSIRTGRCFPAALAYSTAPEASGLAGTNGPAHPCQVSLGPVSCKAARRR